MNDAAPLNIPFMNVLSHHCREVTGMGDDGLALYCGRPKSGPTSYCVHHRRINLVMVADRSRDYPKIGTNNAKPNRRVPA
jgi:hypothetical protein